MNLYNYLKETEILNDLKMSIKTPVQTLDRLIGEYTLIIEDNEKDQYLADMEEQLNLLIKIFDGFGYTYEPEVVPDENEKVFIKILSKYRDELLNFYNTLSKEILPVFNVQTRYVLNLIEVHRTNFIEEGEVLIDTDE